MITSIPSVAPVTATEIQWDAPAPETAAQNTSVIAGELKKLSEVDTPRFRSEASAWAGSTVPDFGSLTFEDLYPSFEQTARAEDIARLHATNPLYPESSRQAFRVEAQRIVTMRDLPEMARYIGQDRINVLLGKPSQPVTVEELRQLVDRSAK